MLRPGELNASDTAIERAVAAYLGLAIGDALGATVEFLTPGEIRHQHGVHRDIKGGGWLKLRPGQVTDDTTMSLALGDAILAHNRADAALALPAAQAFDAWMRAKPVDIGNTVRRNLVSFRRSGDPVAPPSEHDAGNGALMRVLPVALACLGQSEEAVITASRAQAHVTHNNPLSDAACETVIFMLQDLIAARPLDDIVSTRLRPLTARHPAFAHDRKRIENPSGYVVDTLQAVLQAFSAQDGFESILVDIVNRGGDADTTGAIAGMLAGARFGLAAIPPRWIKALDRDIRARCETQASRLVLLAAASPGMR